MKKDLAQRGAATPVEPDLEALMRAHCALREVKRDSEPVRRARAVLEARVRECGWKPVEVK